MHENSERAGGEEQRTGLRLVFIHDASTERLSGMRIAPVTIHARSGIFVKLSTRPLKLPLRSRFKGGGPQFATICVECVVIAQVARSWYARRLRVHHKCCALCRKCRCLRSGCSNLFVQNFREVGVRIFSSLVRLQKIRWYSDERLQVHE